MSDKLVSALPEEEIVQEAIEAGDTKISMYNRRYSINIPKEQDDPNQVINLLRASFKTGKTKTYDWRIQQLQQLKKMFIAGKKEMEEALYHDLHKTPQDAFLTAFSLIFGEIKYHLKHLKRNMRRKKKKTDLLTFPAKSYTKYEPLGCVLVLGPNNFPLQLQMVPVIGAIAAGNCVVIKPGSQCHSTSKVIKKYVDLFLDTDSIQVLQGGREITKELLELRQTDGSGAWDKIFFTGSTHVGKIVARACAETLTPCCLELGGKSPTIVDKSANIDLAAKRVAFSAYVNSGQLCVRTDFILVHRDVKEKFIKAYQTQTKKMFGDQNSEWYCRMVTPAAAERLEKLIESEKDYICFGGKTDIEDKYVEPTLLDYGNDTTTFLESQPMQDEVFGPVVPLLEFDNLSNVIKMINNLKTGKPLSLSIFTNDPKSRNAIINHTSSGALNINDASMAVGNLGLPFGGVGNSGMGRYHAWYSFECFSHEKAIMHKSAWKDQFPGLMRPFQNARFPPYTSFKMKVIRTLT